MSQITTHVLDTSIGRPAAGLRVILEFRDRNDSWQELSRGVTDSEGRLPDMIRPGSLLKGTYRLIFETAAYFASRNVETFYPEVVVVFTAHDSEEHYHIPLLLNRFGYTTYRGS